MTRRLFLLVGVLACQACQHVPPAPIDPAGNADRLEQRSLDDPAVTSALTRYGQPVPDDARWSLDQLTVAAWTLRTDVGVAEAQLAAARAATRVDGQRPNPTVDNSAERVTNDTPSVSPWVLGAGLGLKIETAGKRHIRARRARAREQAFEAQLGQVLWSARAAVRDALLARSFADRTLALDDDEVRLRRAYLDWVDTRLELGAATSQERLLAAEALSQIQSQRGLDRAQLASASAALAAAVGLTPAQFSNVAPASPDLETLPDLGTEDLGAARDAALVNRVDVRRALADYRVAEQDLRAAVAAQYPDISLGPGYLVDQGDRKLTLNLSLPVPLFHSGAAAIDSAVAARAVAAVQFDQVQASALAQIDTGFALYRATRGALTAAEDAEREAQSQLRTAQQRMDAGAANRGDVLGAEINLLVRRRNTLAARRALVDALGAVEDGIQQPLYPSSSLQPAAAPTGAP